MSDLRELYQQVILDHHKRPRNFRHPADATTEVEGYNPLCGDRITVFVKMAGDRIEDLAFQGSGCAISTASASMMTERLKGKSRAEARALFDDFHRLVTSDAQLPPEDESLGKLAVFSGVREFPLRIKCATLAWHALRSALAGEHNVVSTEEE
jgi:nitrogen fixation protein NifU and related proteins